MTPLRLLAVEDRPTLLNGGQERSLFELLPALAKKDVDITLAYREPGELIPEYASAGIRCLHFGPRQFLFRNPLASLGYLLNALALLRRVKPDVLYVNQYFDLPVFLAAARLLKIPVVCHLRLAAPDYVSRQYRWALERCAALIANSAFTRQSWVSAGFNSEIIHTVYNGIDSKYYEPVPFEKPGAEHRIDLLYAGRLSLEKGVGFLLDIFSQLVGAEDNVAYHLTICGAERGSNAPQGWFENALQNLPENVRKRIRVLPPQSDIRPMVYGTDVVLFPTRVDESFGRILVESMAMETPVLATSRGAIPEICGPFAELCTVESDDAWVSRILEVSEMKRKKDGRLAAMRNYVQRKFEFQNYVEAIGAVFIKIKR